jgi:hypothetical protein
MRQTITKPLNFERGNRFSSVVAGIVDPGRSTPDYAGITDPSYNGLQ